MPKILRQLSDMAIAGATGTSSQQIASMRTYDKKLKESVKQAEESLKTAKASGDKETIKKEKEQCKVVKEAQSEIKTSKVLTLFGAGNSQYTNQALSNARNAVSGDYSAVVEQGVVNKAQAVMSGGNRALPDIGDSITKQVEQGLGLG